MASVLALRIGTSVLALLLGFAYVMIGTMKLTPAIDPAQHAMLVEGFQQFPKALYLDLIGIDHVTLRYFVAITEIAMGVLLFTPVALYAAIVLLFVMAGAALTHVRLNEPPYPPLVFAAVLTVFLFLVVQLAAAKGEAAQSETVNEKKGN